MKRFYTVSVILLLAVISVLSALLLRGEKPYSDMLPPQENGVIIDVPRLSQYPYLPTGCEVTAAAMVLQFYEADITPSEFALESLYCDDNFYYKGGLLYGPDPNKVFAGNPFTKNSYGCFAPVITDAVNKTDGFSAETIKGQTLETLCREYIDNKKPLLIWVTMGMRESEEGNRWKLADESEFVWIAGEHCMVLCGYNEQYYYLCDPQSASAVLYEKFLVEKRFRELGSQAVYIYPK